MVYGTAGPKWEAHQDGIMARLKSGGMQRTSIIDGRTPSITLSRLLVGIPFAAVLLVAGDFWLFSILGVKVEAQLLIYTAVGIMALPFLITSKARFVKEPLFILTVSYFLSSLFFARERQTSGISIFTALVPVLLIAGVFSLSSGYRTAIAKSIFLMFGGFAILGIIQFVILLWFPNATTYADAHAFQASYLSGRPNVHPLMLLGFTTGEEYSLFGFPITRISSFLKEPSFIVPYFVITGVLALSYRGAIRYTAIPLLTFAVISISGSAWLSLLMSMAAFLVFKGLRKRRWLLTVLPLLAAIFVGWLVYWSETSELLARATSVLDPLKSEATFFEKEGSIRVRLVTMKDGLELLQTSAFGVPGGVTGSGGLFFHALFTSGYIGGGLVLWMMREYLSRLVMISSDRRYFVFAAMMYGTLLQVLLFTSGGFLSAAGFLILGLVLTRLREMVKETG